MKAVLKIDDVLREIVTYLDGRGNGQTLYALSTVNRAWSEVALDMLWKDIEAPFIAPYMDPSQWRVVQLPVGQVRDGHTYQLMTTHH